MISNNNLLITLYYIFRSVVKLIFKISSKTECFISVEKYLKSFYDILMSMQLFLCFYWVAIIYYDARRLYVIIVIITIFFKHVFNFYLG